MFSLFQLSKLTRGQYSSLESFFDLPLRCANTHTHTHLLNTRHLLSKVRLNIKNLWFLGNMKQCKSLQTKTSRQINNVKNLLNKQCVQKPRDKRKIAQISRVKANRSVLANSLTEQDTYRGQTLYSKFWVPLILKCPVDI